MRWHSCRVFVPKLCWGDLQILPFSILSFIPSQMIFFHQFSLPILQIVFMRSILWIFFKSTLFSILTISLLPCSKQDYTPQLHSLIQIWTILARDGTSPCIPWCISTSDDPATYFSMLSTVESQQLLMNEAKCLAGVLFQLDCLCNRPSVALFCDLQGLVVNSYMNQSAQTVLLRIVIIGIWYRLYWFGTNCFYYTSTYPLIGNLSRSCYWGSSHVPWFSVVISFTVEVYVVYQYEK